MINFIQVRAFRLSSCQWLNSLSPSAAHAIFGLFLYICTGIQWVFGLLTFNTSGFPSVEIRSAVKPYHVWGGILFASLWFAVDYALSCLGVSILAGSAAAIVSGIMSKQFIWAMGYQVKLDTHDNVWMM